MRVPVLQMPRLISSSISNGRTALRGARATKPTNGGAASIYQKPPGGKAGLQYKSADPAPVKFAPFAVSLELSGLRGVGAVASGVFNDPRADNLCCTARLRWNGCGKTAHDCKKGWRQCPS